MPIDSIDSESVVHILRTWSYDSNVPRRSINDEFRLLVQRDGRTLSELAREIGSAKSAMSMYMSGQRGLPLRKLERLAQVLGYQITLTRKGN